MNSKEYQDLRRMILELQRGMRTIATGGGGGSGITQLTSDVAAGPGSGSQAATLSTTGVSAGTYGDATHVGQFTVDAKGRLTAASEIPITGGGVGSPAGFVSISGFYLDDGAELFGPVYGLTPPVDSDFSWVNQGGATITSVNGALYLEAPGNASAQIRIRKKAAPSTPYTITVWMLPNIANENKGFASIGFRESSSGKTHYIRYGYDNSISTVMSVTIMRSNGPTSDDFADMAVPWGFQQILCWRIADNGTNRIFSYSTDGVHFIDRFSLGRTVHLTADEVFFATDSRTTSYPAGVTVLSWAEA